jgi:hypothetical protein
MGEDLVTDLPRNLKCELEASVSISRNDGQKQCEVDSYQGNKYTLTPGTGPS